MVEPDTVVRWHRSAWRAYWRWKSRRRSGRPRIPAELRQLIVRIATENPRWGAVRIVGELRALGFEVSARTVSRYRRQVLRRPPSQSWRTFLRNHASSIWAADRFTVQTLTFRTLYVFVVIEHGRRRIRHWTVTEHPIAPWIWRQMIEATAWGQQPGFLIRDRDRSYGGDFIARARRLGIETILTPVHAPNANAIAERVIGTLRRECLDHVIAVNEQHLRRVLGEYVQHYNAMRPHRSLSLDSPEGRSPVQRTVRARRDLVLENLALRHQLAVYTRGRRRPRLRRHDRRLWSLRARGWSGWRGTLVMVEPDTVVRWHRSAWRAYWRWKSRRRSGRPRIPAELRQLIVRIATEHPRWGAVRIVGELRALGFEVSARTVSRYRRQALRRPPSQSWRAASRVRASRRVIFGRTTLSGSTASRVDTSAR